MGNKTITIPSDNTASAAVGSPGDSRHPPAKLLKGLIVTLATPSALAAEFGPKWFE